jgi:hypothetical protein
MVVQLPREPETDATLADDAESGVIDDARARHRRERWAGAIGLLFGLGGGGRGSGKARQGGSGATPAGSGHNSVRPLAVVPGRGVVTNEFGLMSAGVGWAVFAARL